ncbi:MAG TPA: Gfo/Idh/MocA family oxidoreductase [Ignavibacteria bacterium]
MEKIKIGIIGLGSISQVMHLPILSKFPDVEIVGICDKDKSKTKILAEKFKIHNYYTDYNELLKNEDIKGVIIATPTDTHPEISIAALENNKDVFVEKPIARNFIEAKQINDKAKETKKKLMVGMNNRFRPDAMLLKTFIQKGEIGKIFYIKTGWLKKQSTLEKWFTQKEKSGGGVFLDHGIALLDLSLWMLGFPDVKSVQSSFYYHETKKVEDFSFSMIKLSNNTTLTIEVSWTMLMENDFLYCNMFGSEGSALLNPLKVQKELHGNIVNLTPAKFDKNQNYYKKSIENELRYFINSLKGLTPIVSTGDEAVKRMMVVDAIYQSAENNKEIILNN